MRSCASILSVPSSLILSRVRNAEEARILWDVSNIANTIDILRRSYLTMADHSQDIKEAWDNLFHAQEPSLCAAIPLIGHELSRINQGRLLMMQRIATEVQKLKVKANSLAHFTEINLSVVKELRMNGLESLAADKVYLLSVEQELNCRIHCVCDGGKLLDFSVMSEFVNDLMDKNSGKVNRSSQFHRKLVRPVAQKMATRFLSSEHLKEHRTYDRAAQSPAKLLTSEPQLETPGGTEKDVCNANNFKEVSKQGVQDALFFPSDPTSTARRAPLSGELKSTEVSSVLENKRNQNQELFYGEQIEFPREANSNEGNMCSTSSSQASLLQVQQILVNGLQNALESVSMEKAFLDRSLGKYSEKIVASDNITSSHSFNTDKDVALDVGKEVEEGSKKSRSEVQDIEVGRQEKDILSCHLLGTNAFNQIIEHTPVKRMKTTESYRMNGLQRCHPEVHCQNLTLDSDKTRAQHDSASAMKFLTGVAKQLNDISGSQMLFGWKPEHKTESCNKASAFQVRESKVVDTSKGDSIPTITLR